MKILALGTGNAFTETNFNQSFLLEEGNERLLFDCGRNIMEALSWHKIDIKTIQSVYISHLHNDHTGSLEPFAFSRYDWMGKPHEWDDPKRTRDYAPTLICNSELMKDLWNITLKGGLSCLEGINATLETYFKPQPIEGNATFVWAGWTCKLIQQVHIMTGSMILSTFGLFMEKGKEKIYFTADSQHCSPKQIEVFYKEATLIFQDCEITDFISGVHANFKQLAGYPEANSTVLPVSIRNKMWLSHYQDTYNNDTKGWDAKAAAAGFKGFLKNGQVIEV